MLCTLLGDATLKLEVGLVEAALVEDEVVGVDEDSCEEAVEGCVGALTARAGRVHALRVEIVSKAADRHQSVGGRQKCGEPRQNVASLIDELGRQGAVAVERRIAATLLNNLERKLMPTLSVACQLPCSFLRECVQRGAELAKAHMRPFAKSVADPAVIAAR
ncbi:unannotated protein [freshwater metagenome]|uniref:Unannotated protein n=1 Tax=freshwater metagenome TaxID=449393 RepID=A0A6J5ZMF0_9ZZZZ